MAVPHLARCLLLSGILGSLAGSASALVPYALNRTTGIRAAHVWLLWLLPPVL
ncbi:hypothetical protein LMG27952_05392 [Paraburkholderia hiiakae]|uniref:MFS transporter n=1 Tax=Paraburkholderia hiiakae TaxID=1081782 RepID=A0ABM8P191_9BURK|nr:hypothetical protein LMG27952_05392 [Paraburkholderia hiiakae]